LVKEGQCPRATPKPQCSAEEQAASRPCTAGDDSKCGEASKCCPTECPWSECRVPVKKGICFEPTQCLKQPNDLKTSVCSNDLGCDGKQKCCPTECGDTRCAEPNLIKEGTCRVVPPLTDEQAEALDCRRGCIEDFDCDGEMKCCYNGCEMVCL